MRRLFVALVALGACTPASDAGPVHALFEIGDGADGFFALPYPNDLRVDELGRIDLSAFPRPNALVADYADAVAMHQRGFGISSGMYARFDAAIDPSSLPASPTASLAEQASVYVVDVDPASPGYGTRAAVRMQFHTWAGEVIGPDWLAVLPFPGLPLRERTTYALVVTERVRGVDGASVLVAPDFAAIAGDAPLDPALNAARERYQPLWDWLDEPGGDERADVVSAAVFTTQDATGIARGMYQAVAALPAPAPRQLELNGEDDGMAWYDGVFDIPVMQAGAPPYMTIADGGNIELDDGGVPVVQAVEPLRFSLTVPLGTPPPGGWPVVLYAHGTGGDYHSFVRGGVAARLAGRGLAALSIDQVAHGPRNPSGSSAELAFFNFQNPLAARDNTLQGAADGFQLVRLVAALAASHDLDPARISFFGHSQGGLTGPPFLAFEPAVQGAVLSGAGGLLYLSLLSKTEPVDVAGLVSTIIRDYPLDEFNPILALLQAWVDRSDPVSYGPLLAREPSAGVPRKHIFQSEGFVDSYTPLASIESLALAIGTDQVEPIIAPIPGLDLAGATTIAAPVVGNRDGVTAVLAQYQAAVGQDGHFVVFDVAAARTQSIEFLASLAETGAATLIAP